MGGGIGGRWKVGLEGGGVGGRLEMGLEGDGRWALKNSCEVGPQTQVEDGRLRPLSHLLSMGLTRDQSPFSWMER